MSTTMKTPDEIRWALGALPDALGVASTAVKTTLAGPLGPNDVKTLADDLETLAKALADIANQLAPHT